jgi:hypothetical protein
MSKSHSDSNAGTMRTAALMARGASMAARVQRFRVDEVLREIGRRGRLSTHAAPIAWGLGGFLVGAIFWHLIGFWGFLGSVVLNGPETAVSVVTRQQPVVVARRQAVEPAILPNCTVLALDRSTGRTSSVPCPEHMPMLEEARSHRQDLAFADNQ